MPPPHTHSRRRRRCSLLLLTCIFLIGIFAIEVDIAINLFPSRTGRQIAAQEETEAYHHGLQMDGGPGGGVSEWVAAQ